MIQAGHGRLTDAPATLVIVGARVIDPAGGTDAVRDVAVLDGRLVSPDDVPTGAEHVDARGLVVAPGFCDLHTHLRDPGDAGTETIASGTRAAARGGFTTVCAMPNTEPPVASPDAVRAVLARTADVSARVRVVGAVTAGRAGIELADLEAMATAGVIGFSDDGASVPDEDLVAQALGRLAGLGLPLIEHAEDAEIAGPGVMRAGRTAHRLGLAGWDPRAEVAVVRRDLAVAAAIGARVHLTHLSTRDAIEEVRAARATGVPVTCDVTPHHLALTERWVAGDRRFSWTIDGEAHSVGADAYDGRCRVNPPLTTAADALALLEAVDDGTVDAIATDHAPHPLHRKLVPFDEAAPGLIGLETALSLGLAAVEGGRLRLPALLAALSTRPAAIIGEERGLEKGGVADLVVFDPRARWRVDGDALASASRNTPLLGMELPGVVRLTMADGRVTYRS
jgi:dihydroorotase